MSIPDSLQLLPALVSAALAGRVLLACLPADGSDSRQAPAVWATSLYLGWAGLAIEVDLTRRVGIAPRAWLLALPWLTLALARWLTLPGAMHPRHAPREQRPGPAARALTVVLAAWLVHLGVSSLQAPDEGLLWLQSRVVRVPPAVHVAAAAVFVLHALRVTRRSPTGRAALAVALVLTPAISDLGEDPGASALGSALLVGGAAFGVTWLRRANRRALILALAAFAALPMTGSRAALATGGASLLALLVTTPAASRRRVARHAAEALALAWMISLAVARQPATDGSTLPMPSTLWFWWLLALAAAGNALRTRVVRSHGTIDPPRREHAFLIVQLALCTLATALTTGTAPAGFVYLIPLAALCSGLALPAETPEVARAELGSS